MASMALAGSILLLFCAWGYAGSVQKRHPCTDILEYRELEAMLTHDKCLNVDSLFAKLVSIEVNGRHASCRKALEQKFKVKYPQGSKMPSTCTCTGANVLHHYDNLPNFKDLNRNCARDRHYLNLYDMFFPNPFIKVAVPACRTNHSVWYDLASISSSSCYMDLVKHITNVFENHKDPCSCFDATNAVNSSTTVKLTDVTPRSTDMTTDLSTDITTVNQLATVLAIPTLSPNCENDNDIKALKLLVQVDSCFSIHSAEWIMSSIQGVGHKPWDGAVKVSDKCDSETKVWKVPVLSEGQDTFSSVWYRLNRIQTTNPGCMGIIDILAHHYGEQNTTTCGCTGHPIKPNPFTVLHHNRSFAHCCHDSHFEALEQSLFKGHHGCVDHKLIWSPLHLISNKGECRRHFFEIAASRYSSPMDDPCRCNKTKPILAPVVDILTTTTITTTAATKPTTTTTSTTAAAAAITTTTTVTTTIPTTTTSSTNTVPTTKAPPYMSKHYLCNKFKIIQAFTSLRILASFNVTYCHVGSWDDSFVQTECNVSRVNEWRRGPQLRPYCDQIPQFTPVAVFQPSSKNYNPTGARSGIFGGCLANGFKLIVEHCEDREPAFVHILDGGLFLENPLNYYVIN